MLKRFISYYKPHKKLFALDMLASLLISAIGMVYPIVTNRMLNDYIPNRKYEIIIIAGVAVLALYFLRMLMQYFVQYYGHMIGVKMQAQMRRDLFSHLEKLPYSYYDDHKTGGIMSRLTSDLFDVCELAHHAPESILISSIMVIGSFTYLCTINIPLTLIIFACVPLLVAVSLVLRRKMRDAFKERREGNAMINASIENSITGIRVTKAFTNSEKEIEKFDKNNNFFANANRKAYSAMAKFHSSTSFITDVFNVVIIIAGGIFLYNNQINFADYSTFIVSVTLFISPITTLINFMEKFQDGASGFRRFIEILDTEPERDSEDAEPIENICGEISLENVEFSYNNSKEVLKGISLKVEPGKTLALVGPSGGGKTTICHLLPRFYEFNSGSIKIDGKDIRKVTLGSLRRSIGIVQQDVFLFDGTVRENIKYGNPSSSDEDMIEAAKNANIHDYVMSLEKGYDTEIGERGVKLSGGQKQRISIARVFLKNPPIIILDEATSALDNTTEILIQSALDRLCLGRTTIVVAHRLSTIRRADEIAVIRSGEIAEQGTHDELMAKGGIYSKLYSLQFRENDENFEIVGF
jgi:ATP-binding cassette subfamily B protein